MRTLLAVALAATLSLPAIAQADPSEPSPSASSIWAHYVGAQYADLLASEHLHARATALVHIQHLAQQRPELDLSATVEPLLDLYASAPADGVRMAAVAALHALGNVRGMERLAELSLREASPSVRHVTQAALQDYVASLPAAAAADLSFRVR